MAATAELSILIRAKNDASKVFGEINKDTATLTQRLQSVGKLGFLAVGAAAAIGAGALLSFTKDASNLNESMSKVQVVFGKNADEIKKWASTAATSIGQSKQQALEAAGTFGNLFSALGLSSDKTKTMSIDVVKLSADLASFNNIAGSDALEKLRAGLVGEAEPLRSLGVNINAATTEAMALQLGFQKVNGTFTDAEKVQARYALIVEQTSLAQGDFARTSEGLANQQRILSAVWADTRASLGQILLPLLTAATKALGGFLTDHQADIQRFTEWMNVQIPNAIGKMSDAIQRAKDIVEPFWSALDQKDKIVILLALAAVIAGPLVIAMLAFAVASAVAFATNPITLWIVAIGLITVAVTLMVRHWDQVWATMKAAPAALLNWLQNNWRTALLGAAGPVGWFILLLKHWNSIFDAMPSPVRSAMNSVASIVGGVINFLIAGFNKVIDAVNGVLEAARKVDRALPESISGWDVPGNIGHVGDVDLTRDAGGGGGSNIFSRNAASNKERRENISGALQFLAAQAEMAAPAVMDLGTGAGGLGSAAGGAAAAVDQAALDFAEFGRLFAQWSAATGGTLPQFVARIEMMQTEAELNKQLADAQFRSNVEMVKAADAGFQMRTALMQISIELLKSGRTITEFLRDIAQKSVDTLRSAFDSLLGRPTRERAELDLEIARLEEQKAIMEDADARQEEIDAITDQIAELQRHGRVMSAQTDVLRAQMAVADQTLVTENQRNFAAALYIIALQQQSTALVSLTNQAAMEALARSHLIDAMNNQAGALGSSVSARDPFTDDEKRFINRFAEGKGEAPPFPGFAMGGLVSRDGLYQLHQGEKVLNPNQARTEPAGGATVIQHITVYSPTFTGGVREGIEALGLAV